MNIDTYDPRDESIKLMRLLKYQLSHSNMLMYAKAEILDMPAPEGETAVMKEYYGGIVYLLLELKTNVDNFIRQAEELRANNYINDLQPARQPPFLDPETFPGSRLFDINKEGKIL